MQAALQGESVYGTKPRYGGKTTGKSRGQNNEDSEDEEEVETEIIDMKKLNK